MTELLVDGNGLTCRLWWADPANMAERFYRAVQEVQSAPCRVLVCWDSPPSWRLSRIASYKAHRGPKPRLLVAALQTCRGLYEDLESPGLEADDLIAIEARRVVAASGFCVVMSDDKDVAQLVGPRCRWLARGVLYDEAAVTAKFGVRPDRLRHLLSWEGDKVDGLPGVAGYGRKKSIPKALAGEIGDPLTYELVGLGGPDA